MENCVNVIYSANVDSMDSWDMDNLKYLRKLSKGNPISEQELETMSYHSDITDHTTPCFLKDSEDLLQSAIYSSQQGRFLKKSLRNGRTGQRRSDTIEKVLPFDTNNNIIGSEVQSVMSEKSSLPTALDDCYVMDVLIVRNESVLTDKSFPSPPKSVSPELKVFELSRRDATSSPSSISSDDSFTSAIAKGFFDMDHRSSNSSKRIHMRPRSLVSQMIFPVKYGGYGSSPIIQQSKTDESPFCGGCGRTDTFYFRKRKAEDLREIMKASLAPTVGGEAPPIDMPNTPSPSYIRLRKDLLLSNSPPLSLNKPKNFALDKQGQLVIDYSSNWDSLESYIQSLSIQS